MKVPLRPDLTLETYNSSHGPLPFVVETSTKIARRVSPHEAKLVELWSKADAGTPSETSEIAEDDDTLVAAERFRDLGWVDDGRGRAEQDAAARARWHRENRDALRETLAFAAESMPMYAGRIPPSADLDALTRIPILTKAGLRSAFPAGYARNLPELYRGIQSGRFSIHDSSGTTSDERSRVVCDARRFELALASGQFINRHMWPSITVRRAMFTTLHCSGLMCARDMPQMEMRTGAVLTLLPPEDPIAPTSEEITRTLREITVYGADVLRVDPVYLAHLTWAALDHGIELPQMRYIDTSFEYLSKLHRRLLSRAWQCPVFSDYAATEIRGIPMVECEHHTYHVNDRFIHLEVLRDGKPARPGEVGRVIATLLRSRLPLVRFDTGDLMIAADPNATCPCGGVQSIVGRIAGRARDTVVTPERRVLTTADVDDALAAAEGVRFYQLVRSSQDDFTLTVTSDPNESQTRVEESVRNAMRPLVGAKTNLAIAFGRVFPERSGKFRNVVSQVESEVTIEAEARQPTSAPFALLG